MNHFVQHCDSECVKCCSKCTLAVATEKSCRARYYDFFSWFSCIFIVFVSINPKSHSLVNRLFCVSEQQRSSICGGWKFLKNGLCLNGKLLLFRAQRAEGIESTPHDFENSSFLQPMWLQIWRKETLRHPYLWGNSWSIFFLISLNIENLWRSALQCVWVIELFFWPVVQAHDMPLFPTKKEIEEEKTSVRQITNGTCLLIWH